MTTHEVVLRGGRVIDPETGLDGVRDVGLDGRRISAVSETPLEGRLVLDVSGNVVAPGFIDLHSHAQTLAGRRLQVCDGVTTVLDLEAGRAPVDAAYEREAVHGSPVHYGWSASWAAARMQVVMGVPPDAGFGSILDNIGDPAWQRAASDKEVAQILDLLRADIADGAIGIGLLMGYCPGADPEEYVAVAQLAADAGVPTFTHCRDLVEITPEVRIDGAEEIVRAAGETGAHMHHCHINSTSSQHIERVLGLVERCQHEGGHVTIEAYPYGSGSTAIGAAFLTPEKLAARGMDTTVLTYLPTGERVADAARLNELRAMDPAGLVIFDFLNDDDPHDHALLRKSLQFPDSIVASDGMPPVWTEPTADPLVWPLPPGAVTHPRTAGCFSRALRLWREEGESLAEAVRRSTLLPAKVLEACAPAFRTKGRLQVGADADVVVFDPDTVTDQATYMQSTRPSTGITHVIVDGEFAVRDTELVLESLPGRPVRAQPA
ncbi:MAG: amidohydrolase family protein [Actinobacteria bacterium]|nr:amidohydrolase family protein [Actinomycetota bacterium]MBV9932767.1 amidohydrolase family protein [Actinomycetota bacterium]